MKLAVMQPYLFPYIGYFQLIHAVDTFVLYDDVQYIKDGWVNRNRLLINKQIKLFTLPLKKDSYTAKICERCIAMDRWRRESDKLLTMIRQSYAKAPCFEVVYPLVERCIKADYSMLIDFLQAALVHCCRYLGITTEIVRSSSMSIAMDMKGQERIVAICKAMGADHYLNASGAGRSLYDKDAFRQEGIQLSFAEPLECRYPQYGSEFVPRLSIIDVMMFSTRDLLKKFLDMYKLD